ncbi:MAG: hypothetical protein B7Y84_14390 [Azorhizobium sp. 32-67-21]|nr:MAG: hypothetical protein B7Y84_14390 [Azorhizobium sp. 32-67-21]
METLELERPMPREESRAKRMKAATRDAHQEIDDRIMAAAPFASRENYARFVRLQYRVHHAVDPLFRSGALGALLPDLAGRRRLDLVEQDAADLGIALPDLPPAAEAPQDTAAALGWLYVVEGSNLGAAFLLKAAGALGFGEDFAALTGRPEGSVPPARAPSGRRPVWLQKAGGDKFADAGFHHMLQRANGRRDCCSGAQDDPAWPWGCGNRMGYEPQSAPHQVSYQCQPRQHGQVVGREQHLPDEGG